MIKIILAPMKTTFLFLLLAGVFQQIFALPSYEPFMNATAAGGTTYSNGATLYHQTNAMGDWWAHWNGGSTTQFIPCTNIGLAYSGFPAAFLTPPATNGTYVPGNDDHAGGTSGQQPAYIFSKIIKADPNNLVVNAIYASFLMQVPTLGEMVSGNATYFAGFATNDATSDNLGINLPNSAMKIFLKGNSSTAGSSTAWSIGVANNSGSGSAAWDGGGHTGSQVVFVVVDYEFGINGNSDYARLWVNPTAASFGASTPPTPTASTAGIIGNNRIAQAADFFLQDRTSTSLWGSLRMADFRAGTTWSYVTGGPEVTVAPSNISSSPSVPVTLSVAVLSGSTNDALFYQWSKNGSALSDGGNVTGSATPLLTLLSVSLSDSATYSVLVTNALGGTTSFATLTVLDPYINRQPPAALNIPTGNTALFSTTESGTAPFTYQWYKNGAGLGNGMTPWSSIISGVATSNLTISSAAPSDSGTYTLVVTNAVKSTTVSSNSVLIVSDPIVINQVPNIATNYLGTAAFPVAPGGTPPFSYQWQLNGKSLSDGPAPSGSGATVSGSHTTNLVVSGVAYPDGGSYAIVVTNGAGKIFISPPGTLTVADPYIITSPVSQTDLGYATTVFSVAAGGSGSVTYRWSFNGTALSDGGNIIGSAAPNLSIANLSVNDDGTYSVVVSGAGPSVQSQATLAVTPVYAVYPSLPLITNFQGWGCSLCWWANVIGGWTNRDYYADLAFNTLKFNVVRYNIGGGQNPNVNNTEVYYANMPGFSTGPGQWNWNADTNQRWMLQAAWLAGSSTSKPLSIRRLTGCFTRRMSPVWLDPIISKPITKQPLPAISQPC